MSKTSGKCMLPEEYDPWRRTSSPSTTAPLRAFAKLPDSPACLSAPTISPSLHFENGTGGHGEITAAGVGRVRSMTLLTT